MRANTYSGLLSHFYCPHTVQTLSGMQGESSIASENVGTFIKRGNFWQVHVSFLGEGAGRVTAGCLMRMGGKHGFPCKGTGREKIEICFATN